MNKYVNSDKIISRVEIVSNYNRAKIAKELFNISPNNLSNRIRENRLDFYKLLQWSINNSVNIDWLITGEGEMTQKEDLSDADAGKSNVAQFPIDEPKPSYQEDDPRITELLEAAKRVLKSGNEIAFDALERNIRYFDHSIQSEKRFQDVEGRMNNMENDVSEIKKYFKDFMDSQKEKKEGVHNI